MTLNLKRFLNLESLDRKLAIFFLGVGLVIVVAAVTVLQSLILLQVAVTLLLASGIYLFLSTRRRASSSDTGATEIQAVPTLRPYLSKLLDIIFWGLLIASLLIISREAYSRPLSFLILVSAMAAILAIEIFTGKNTAYCLIKILIIGTLLRASAWYQFPSPTGTDPIIELGFFRQLLASGHIGDFMRGYAHHPVAYVLTAATSFVTGLGPKDSFFILAIIEVISLVFVFLIGREFFDTRIGLLAALIVSVFDWHVFWGFWVKAMTLGIAWLPMLVFLVLLVARRRGGAVSFSMLSLLLTFLINLTHPFASGVMVAVLAIVWLAFLTGSALGQQKPVQPVTLTLLMFAFVTTLGYWMSVSGSMTYISFAIKYGLTFDTFGAQMFSLPRSAAVLTWQKLPMLIFVFFAVLGCLAIFNIRKPDKKTLSQVSLALICGALVILTFILFYLPQLSALESTRWYAFAATIIAVPVAKGLLNLLGKKPWWNVILFLLVFLFAGIATTSHYASVDPVIPWEKQERRAFTSSEMAAAESVGQMAGLTPAQVPQGNTEIYADFAYTLLLEWEFQIPPDNIVDASALYKEEEEEYHGILLLRKAVTELVSATFASGHEEFVMSQAQYQAFIDDPRSFLVYDNGIVKALKRP